MNPECCSFPIMSVTYLWPNPGLKSAYIVQSHLDKTKDQSRVEKKLLKSLVLVDANGFFTAI